MFCFIRCTTDHWHAFAEKDYKGAEKRSIASQCAGLYFTVLGSEKLLISRVIYIPTAAHLHEFAVQMDYF